MATLAAGNATTGDLNLNNDPEVDSGIIVKWDGETPAYTGTDHQTNPQPTDGAVGSFGTPVDLTDDGISNHFRFGANRQDGGFNFVLTVYQQGGGTVSWAGSSGPGFTTPKEFLIPMADFTKGSGKATLEDFSQVTAIVLSIQSDTTARDFSINLFDTVPAYLRIIKEVSVQGPGGPWHDANLGDTIPSTAVGNGVFYRITVSNPGAIDFSNVVVSDEDLGIVDYPVGNLPAGGVPVVLTSGQIGALAQPDRCLQFGPVTNVAKVTGTTATASPLTVTAQDQAVVNCVTEGIEVKKEVKVGGFWYDANDPPGTLNPSSPAPLAALGEPVSYRITVTNIGTTPLTGVVVRDDDLGVLDHLVQGVGDVGDLAVGETVILTSAEIPALYTPLRCAGEGTVVNTAEADGFAVTDAGSNPVNDSDPAYLICATQNITLKKQVSIDGGDNWSDADATGPALALGEGALYRLIVKNTGAAP
jgi:uncharacterized repeat protein (TIGR01451 family)